MKFDDIAVQLDRVQNGAWTAVGTVRWLKVIISICIQ